MSPVLDLIETEDILEIHWDDYENRFNRATIDEWHGVVDQLEQRTDNFAVVISGTGKFFSNGLDLEWFDEHPDLAMSVVNDVHRLFGRFLTLPRYIVAAINGHCFAGGAMLALCCDYKIMRNDRGYICLPEADLGIPLTSEMFAVVSGRLPMVTARHAILTGRRYNAEAAATHNIVDGTASEARVMDDAREIARSMANKSRTTLGTHKTLLSGEIAAHCGVRVP